KRLVTHRRRRRRELESERLPEEEEEEYRTQEVRGNKAEATVGGLQFFSKYLLTLTAFNSFGDGPHSKAITFETPEGGTLKRVCVCVSVSVCVCVCVCVCEIPSHKSASVSSW